MTTVGSKPVDLPTTLSTDYYFTLFYFILLHYPSQHTYRKRTQIIARYMHKVSGPACRTSFTVSESTHGPRKKKRGARPTELEQISRVWGLREVMSD